MADNLTKAARNLISKTSYISLSQNPINFTIIKSTVNSKYAVRSRKAFHSISLCTYQKDRNNWSDKTIDLICWQIYCNSLSKFSPLEKIIFYKFINDRLPTKARNPKYYPFRTKHCHQCQCDNKNEDHILHCFSLQRKQARKIWLDELQDYFSPNPPPPEVKLSIMIYLNNWLESTNTTSPPFDADNPDLQSAIQQQFNIGWKH
jgi:hypothetical protein